MLELNYPLDIGKILRKKKSIKRQLLTKDQFIEKKIAILGGSTTSEIRNILELFLLNNDIKPSFYESDYNKFYEDALFGNEELDRFGPDIIYIHTSCVNITSFPNINDSASAVDDLLKSEITKYQSIWSALSKYGCTIIQNNFDFPLHRSLGNLDGSDIHGKTHFINLLNLEVAKATRELKNLYINDINYLSSYLGLSNWFDPSLWYQAKYALAMDAIPELTYNISKIINAIFGKSKKCLILDLDNTCWGGVIGDDGINGISIGTETALSESHTAFQIYASELKNRGISLAVCSKNDFDNAKEGFEHPDTVLKFDDFTSFKANWNPKHQNIIEISEEINIGIDSLVFIDDNPVERDIVSSQIPSTSVPDVGSDVIYFIDFIDRNGYFEPVTLSADDLHRNEYYKGNQKRANQQAAFNSYEDFLVSLEMTAEIKTFKSVYLDRITQLTNKTNQFNLTTKRYTTGEIEQLAESNDYIKLYGKLSDKYGNNGLITVVIGEIKDKQCHIDLWLMSCRVLKRGMEFAMLEELVKQCKSNNICELIGYYQKSKKNSMVSDLYENFGFTCSEQNDDSSTWNLNISDYTINNNCIGVNND